MKEGSTRWINNGLPRKGWQLVDVEDLEGIESTCEWCGTAIRYVHFLEHEEIAVTTTAGCICAEHLTDDYVTHRSKEKSLRLLAAKRKRDAKKALENRRSFIDQFKISKNGNYFLNYRGYFVLIYEKNGVFKMKIDDVWGKKSFLSKTDAAIAAYDYITKRG